MQHRTVLRRNPRPKVVDVDQALSAVSTEVRLALLTAHKVLNELGVAHVLVGGLAVGAHGYPYATQDVDFLVGDEAFHFGRGGLVSFAPGVPIQIGGVAVDYLSPIKEAGQDRIIEDARGKTDLQVIVIEQLVYMKLAVGRQKDQSAIVGLLQRGADVDLIRAFLTSVAPDLIPRFDRLLERAKSEEQ